MSGPGSQEGHSFSQLISLSVSPAQGGRSHMDAPLTEAITRSSPAPPHLRAALLIVAGGGERSPSFSSQRVLRPLRASISKPSSDKCEVERTDFNYFIV